MKWTKTFIQTLREDPQDAEIDSHKLLVRAGICRKTASGLFTFMPLGVNLALENVWNRFLISPMEWKFFLDQFGSKRVGIYFDVANCCLNCRPEDFPEILGDSIKAVHLKNFAESDSAGGLHGFGDDLFKGVVDFRKLFAAFAKIGYTGPYTVEMIPFSRLPDLVMPDSALAEKMVAQIKELGGIMV